MKMLNFWALLSFFMLGSISFLVAQEEENKNEDIESKRHVEVRVELNNESELEGIVVDGRFYEKYDDKKNRWKAMPSRKGSGLRLWHVEKAEGYIYLSYETDIRRIEEIGKKSQRELDELRAEILRIKEAEAKKNSTTSLTENKEESKTEETKKDSENKGELSAEQIQKYEEILQKFPEDRFSLSKIVQAIKMRMASGIPLSKDHKDFLNEYELWRNAMKWKKNEPPIKEVTEEQVVEAQKLLAKFPPESYAIPTKVSNFSSKAVAEVPLPPLDEEWLSGLDKWLDAQIIVKLAAEKEKSGSSKSSENKGSAPKEE